MLSIYEIASFFCAIIVNNTGGFITLGFSCRSIRKKKEDTTDKTAVAEEEDSKAKRTSKMEVKLLSGQTVFYAVSGIEE